MLFCHPIFSKQCFDMLGKGGKEKKMPSTAHEASFSPDLVKCMLLGSGRMT